MKHLLSELNPDSLFFSILGNDTDDLAITLAFNRTIAIYEDELKRGLSHCLPDYYNLVAVLAKPTLNFVNLLKK